MLASDCTDSPVRLLSCLGVVMSCVAKILPLANRIQLRFTTRQCHWVLAVLTMLHPSIFTVDPLVDFLVTSLQASSPVGTHIDIHFQRTVAIRQLVRWTQSQDTHFGTNQIPQQMLKLGDTLHCRGSHIPTQFFRRISNVTSDQGQPKQFSNCSPVHRVFFRTQRCVRHSLDNRHGTSRRNLLGILHSIQIQNRINVCL